MRISRNTEIFQRNGKLYEVLFHPGSYAEHEYGIEGIENMFRVDSNLIGIKKYQINTFPEESVLLKEIKYNGKSCWMLLCSSYINFRDNDDKHLDTSSEEYGHKIVSDYGFSDLTNGMSSIWSSQGFGLLVDNTHENDIKELYESLKNCDLAISMYPTYYKAGLLLTICSQLTESELQELYDFETEN